MSYMETLMQNNDKEYLEITEAMEDDDWALIIGANGDLKGLFIPRGKEEEVVPNSIVDICEQYFGVDVDSDTGVVRTLH